jgi:hypothetical protein
MTYTAEDYLPQLAAGTSVLGIKLNVIRKIVAPVKLLCREPP